MLHHLPERDGIAIIRQLGHVFVNVIVQGKFALLLQQQDSGGGELLAH